jgi:hypothetical protein
MVWVWLGFLGSLLAVVIGTMGLILLWPQRVVELSLDPPEDAAYVRVTEEEERRRILEAQIFWLSWTKNGGSLSRRTMWEVVDGWNKQYQRYPQYKEWVIARDAMMQTINRYYASCQPIPLPVNGGVEWFIVLPEGKQGRVLQPLKDVLGLGGVLSEAGGGENDGGITGTNEGVAMSEDVGLTSGILDG